MRPAALTILALSSLLLAPAPACAGEKKITESKVPKPILEKVKHKYPGAKLRAFSVEDDKGKTLYEVSLESGDKKIDIDLTPDGKIMAEEILLKPGDLPDAVKRSIAGSKYKGWKVVRAERTIPEENESKGGFEVLLESKAGKVELEMDAAGNVTKTEEKKPGDEEDDD